MHILVLNCGSSSVKAAVLEHKTGKRAVGLKIERIGEEGKTTATVSGQEPFACPATHEGALAAALPAMLAALPEGVTIDGVGHRAVHGGEEFSAPVRITDEVVAKMEALTPLAPLHMPSNLAAIHAAREMFPELIHVAVFDTAFHASLPNRARTYAIDPELAAKHGIRRYGFHGTSHAYVASKAAEHLNSDVRNLRIITCHLGNGCSVAAVEYGRSVETSMGMTPLEGLAMGTRSGDIDPGVLIHLMREEGWSVDELDHFLNKKSGMAGLSGLSNDMRDIEHRAAEGCDSCRRALQVFTHRVRKYIGAYAAVMGGVDAIVFTGGIGENSEVVRHRVMERMDFLGALVNHDRNITAEVAHDNPVEPISWDHSRCAVLVVKTDELLAIAQHTAKLHEEHDRPTTTRSIPVAVSARHVHLSQETVEALFGEGHQLTELRPLSQPGQFACEEQVTLIGPKRTIEKVRVLGPARSKNQVEISRTDEFWLGVDAPVRASGDIANTPGILLEGTDGRQVRIQNGVICAWRHIHMTTADAEEFGVQDRDLVEVEVGQNGGRSLVFKDVMVRVKDSYKLEMHIDTDEGNAAELGRGAEGVLIGTEGLATLRKRRVMYDPV